MKIPLLRCILLFISVTTSVAQGFERIEVVQVDSASAMELYHKAERWFVDTFNDADEVIQLRDTATRMIVGRATTTVPNRYGKMSSTRSLLPYSFALEFQAKEGRYRARIYQAELKGEPLRDEQCCWGKCDGGGEIFRQSMFASCERARAIQDELLQLLKSTLYLAKGNGLVALPALSPSA